MLDNSYAAVMARKNEIMKRAVGMDYDLFESGSIAFDYEAMMAATGYTLDAVRKIQMQTLVISVIFKFKGLDYHECTTT